MKTTKSNFRIIFILAMLVFIGLTYFANQTVINATKVFNTGNINEVSFHKVGLLLGTSKYVRTGVKNEYFFNRIDATLALYKAKKIKYVIISGDNSTKNYNEPLDMKNELVAGGIPDSNIFLDYAGFRTLDAVVRAKEIFGQDSFLIISQKFHNERAIYLARKNDIKAFGFNAKDVNSYGGIRTRIREFFARDKMFLDLLIGVKPKFLGKKVFINNSYKIKDVAQINLRKSERNLNGLENDTTNKIILISSGQLFPYLKVKIRNISFDLVIYENDTIYIATNDMKFLTPEGFKVGTRLSELPKNIQKKLIKERGWGYYYKLSSGWSLGFCEGNSCTDNYPKSFSKVKWIFKRKR